MKAFKISFLTMVAMAMVFFACSPDGVTPNESDNGPSVAALEEDPHPPLTPICSVPDTIDLADELTGSLQINYCGFFPCQGTQPNWGFIEFYNGADGVGGTEYMVMNFTMAIGWYIDVQRSKLDLGQNFNIGQNGVPLITGGDWIGNNIQPLRNQWQLRIPAVDLPGSCFEMALNMEVVKVNFFGQVDQMSRRQLWGYNPLWNDPNSDRQSVSPYVTGYCLATCPGNWPDPDSVCVTNYVGNNNLDGCVTLEPDVTGATGSVSYEWATGETTASLTACPNANTTYTVSITDDNGPWKVYDFLVNNWDVSCGNGNGNNGIHKVYVCHIPPGNPNNPQTICIDWSGVPAHVEAYRTPQMNPKKGHDSGCSIGECGQNPCAL